MIKPCTKCGKTKPRTTEYYYKNRERLQGPCKVCWLAANKNRYAKVGRTDRYNVPSIIIPGRNAALAGHTERIQKELGII